MASELQQRKGVADYQDQKQFVSELFTSAEGAISVLGRHRRTSSSLSD